MTHLLHIDSSPMGDYSTSRQLAGAFRKVWAAERPEGEVVYRDLGAEPLPHLTASSIMTFFMPEEARSESQQESAVFRTALAQELLNAESVLVSAPMHNWTIPSHLKAWIDQVLILGQTLVYDGVPKPLAGRPATVILSYGGGYTADAPLASWNHIEPYLHTVFAEALGMDLTVITAQLTLAQDPELAELAKESRKNADLAVDERARKIASGLAAA